VKTLTKLKHSMARVYKDVLFDACSQLMKESCRERREADGSLFESRIDVNGLAFVLACGVVLPARQLPV
jgi:hypothetical protein